MLFHRNGCSALIMVFYDWGLELSEFLSMCLTFNSTEVFTCLKYLNTMMNCEQAMKKTIKCTYVINTLKLISISCSIHFLCSCNYQRLQLYSDFLMLIVRPNDLNLPPLLSSFLPQGQADLSCLSLCKASHLSWDTYAHFTCSMKHLREHMIKNQRWSSGPFTMLQRS